MISVKFLLASFCSSSFIHIMLTHKPCSPMVPVGITIVMYFSSPGNFITLSGFFVEISKHSFLLTSFLSTVYPIVYFKADNLDSFPHSRPTFLKNFFLSLLVPTPPHPPNQSKLKTFAHFPASWECEDWLNTRMAEIACHFCLPPATTVFITETGSPDNC